jgi:choline dehydrogenase
MLYNVVQGNHMQAPDAYTSSCIAENIHHRQTIITLEIQGATCDSFFPTIQKSQCPPMSPYRVQLQGACFFLLLYLLLLQPVESISFKASHATPVRSPDALHSIYDFVIIGGGASGLTVADRLTEDLSTTVLVLEYGPFDAHEPSVLVPGLLNLTSTPYWFNLTSTPQTHLNNRTFQVTIAAAVGGGTVINGMFFHRGAKADYDAWEELGAHGWGWSDLLPYFKKSETFTPPNASFAK